MVEKKRGSRWKYLLLGLLVIAFIFLIFTTYAKNCGEDKLCFDDALDSCMNAKYYHIEDSNTYLYEIKGTRGDYCLMTAHLEKMGLDVESGVKTRLEGKGMVCEIDPNIDVYNTKELSVACTGPLKEALLQMSVEKLYGFVVKTFGKVLVQEQVEENLPYPILKG